MATSANNHLIFLHLKVMQTADFVRSVGSFSNPPKKVSAHTKGVLTGIWIAAQHDKVETHSTPLSSKKLFDGAVIFFSAPGLEISECLVMIL